MKPIVLYGSGGHAREVAEIVTHARRENSGPELVGFLDEDISRHGVEVDGFPVLGDFRWLKENLNKVDLIVAVGHIPARRRLAEEAGALGASFGSAISPLAHLSSRCKVGEGAMIFPRAVVSLNVTIGRHVILGVHSNVSHDSVVGDFAFVCPGAIMTGNTTLGEEAKLCTGASIIPGKSVGRGAVIGAGGCVVRDIPAGVTAVGVPARPRRGGD